MPVYKDITVCIMIVVLIIGSSTGCGESETKSTTLSQSGSPTTDTASTSQEQSSLTFMGYDCGDDCSDHEAGYKWAEENGIQYLLDCPDRNSASFQEGCWAFVEGKAGQGRQTGPVIQSGQDRQTGPETQAVQDGQDECYDPIDGSDLCADIGSDNEDQAEDAEDNYYDEYSDEYDY